MSMIRHFLLVFDRAEGRLLEEEHFHEDGAAALAAYEAKEQQNAGDRNIEVVLIGSDSIDTVRVTHANYFDGNVAVSKYLAGI